MQQPWGKKFVKFTSLWSTMSHNIMTDCGSDLWQVCNHESKCHCDPGWAPPFCDMPLTEQPEGMGGVCYVVSVCPDLHALMCVSASLYARPFNDHAPHMVVCAWTVYHQDWILETDFSWTLKQLRSVPMSACRHWFNGSPLLVCTNAVMMLQCILFPEQMT